MKENDLNNKAEKLYVDLNKEVDSAFALLDKVLSNVKKDVFDKMTPKEMSKHNAFFKKHTHLKEQGKIKEAQDFRDTYMNQLEKDTNE